MGVDGTPIAAELVDCPACSEDAEIVLSDALEVSIRFQCDCCGSRWTASWQVTEVEFLGVDGSVDVEDWR